MTPAVDAAAVIARLREADVRSGGRREAWGAPWAAERERLVEHARALVPGVEIERDAFANLWFVVPGRRAETLLLASHVDCVPGGGWLDGILGVHAGLGVLAALTTDGPGERTIAVADWADEEGTRFGRSLLGSSMATGQATRAEIDGLGAAAVLAEHGVVLDRLGERSPRLAHVAAALELHIEQGPILERAGRACAAVSGCLGVRRLAFALTGAAGHAGATPMADRRDPVRAAAEAIAAIGDAGEGLDGYATVGRVEAEPAIPTAIAQRCAFTVDLRHPERDRLVALERAAADAADAAAERHGCGVERRLLWEIDPIAFDSTLVERAVRATGGGAPVVSGPLHDSAALARAGIPAAMVFAPSIGGISHTRAEDTAETDLAEAIATFARLAGELAVSP
ncbi:hydantoinase/carbamoylase family amidase [Capillimicrobium parvum]|uniref:Allantoate amidohydrolase n=1 Tax=Capillimicrobium parvum TaxID=2884022 RepID=A0A9E7C0M0_9ACTN|nr:hydantoinase/carbamoylase family amidase [Capillimicrobium parvum]UGS35533.1 Allantoate amidohydrolase [Capillimicrobium parvum]